MRWLRRSPVTPASSMSATRRLAFSASATMGAAFRSIRILEAGHLYLALPPLYRLTQGAKQVYARDDAHRDLLIARTLTGKAKIEINRFKGLGDMLPAQLKETTMDPKRRGLLRVVVLAEHREGTSDAVERLMGNRPEARFVFIQERAAFATAAGTRRGLKHALDEPGQAIEVGADKDAKVAGGKWRFEEASGYGTLIALVLVRADWLSRESGTQS
jgi:hypothetical protein